MLRTLRVAVPHAVPVLIASLISLPLHADQPSATDDVAELLKQPILDAGQPLAEVQAYCEARIATLSTPDDWNTWQRDAEALRQRVLERIVFRGVPSEWREAGRVEWLDTVDGGPGYHIKKLRYEALPGLWIPALLYEPDELADRVPVVLNVNGHDGNGKAAEYKQIRCINQAKRGMLALNVEWLGMGQLRGEGFVHYRMNQLDLCGTSGLAPFYLAMQRALDLLLDHPHADPHRVAMAGLSGGGWQTILFSALDPRVTLSNPVAGYSSYRTRTRYFSDLGDSEQTPADLAALADYTHLTALRAPRPTLLTYNAKDDCCFASPHALPPLLNAAKPVFELAGASGNLRWHVNEEPGTHNFERENREALYRMLGDHFYPGDASFDAAEIDSDGEIKTAEALHVPLPEANLDFQKLARGRLAQLRRNTSGDAALRRTAAGLANIVRLEDYQAVAEVVGERSTPDTQARYWRISLADEWTLPVVELTRGDPQATALVAADAGRAAAAEEIEDLLSAEYRVLAVDPFYLGESKIESRDFLFALLVSSVGGRPLGIQASQLQAVTRWATAEFDQPVERVVAVGPRIALAALVATATAQRSDRAEDLVLHDSLASLGAVIERNWSVDKYPELFCFGLAAHGDIDDLIEWARPCAVQMK